MESFRKWFYKPKRDDSSLLAQFFYADEDLNMVAAELDSFDGRKDPERCSSLVNHLRQCQDKVLNICSAIMDDLIPQERTSRDFRAKFPDDVMQENLAGQLWFGAECLAAGSSIMNREGESAAMRPLAKALTKSLENVRALLREQCFRTSANNIQSQSQSLFTDRLLEALKIFDRLFAEFELRYVSAMVPVKSPREYFLQQMVVVLFSETLERALKLGLISQESVDDYDPALMFTIPRLAIVSGLLLYPSGPICLDKTPSDMSEMFRPFRSLLLKIRTLLWTLTRKELHTLERHLCSLDEPSITWNCVENVDDNDEFDLSTSSSSSSSDGPTDQPTSGMHNPPDDLVNQGYLIPNLANGPPVATSSTDAPIIAAHSLPDGDHVESLNIVTETLSSFLANSGSGAGDCTHHPTTSHCDADESNCMGENNWDKLRAGSTVSLELPQRFVMSTTDAAGNYRIRTSTRQPLQSFDGVVVQTRRKRRKFIKTRGNTAAVRVNLSLKIPSHSKRLSRANSLSSSCSSCLASESCSLSEDSTPPSLSAYPEYYDVTSVDAEQQIDLNETRARFRSSEDLLHRLFVCIAGVADQLQTNFAGDLRNTLKCVFQMNSSPTEDLPPITSSSPTSSGDSSRVESAEEAWESPGGESSSSSAVAGAPAQTRTNCDDVGSDARTRSSRGVDDPPVWVPDVMAPRCMTCEAAFTLVRRRHHCRNCGKVFCSRCSSNSVPLPRYGHLKPVRVCNRCFLCQVTPFTLEEAPTELAT